MAAMIAHLRGLQEPQCVRRGPAAAERGDAGDKPHDVTGTFGKGDFQSKRYTGNTIKYKEIQENAKKCKEK